MLSTQLREAGFKVEIDIKGRNMSKNLKFASSRGAKFAVFIGEDELNQGTAVVRTMASGEQNNVKFEELIEYFQKLVEIQIRKSNI
jgi:histidyl-tRNA synthetase